MNKKKKAWKRGGLLKSVNGVFQSCCSGRAARREGGAREKETVRRRNRGRQRRKETGTWKTRLFLSSSQLELWKSERGPTWSCTLPEERAAFPSRSHSSEPVAFPNQSLAQPASAPLVYILMNQSDYSGRFWSVSVWCFFSTVTVHSVFVISPPPERSVLDNFRLRGLLNKGFTGTNYVCELGRNPRIQCCDEDLRLTQHPYMEWWSCVALNEAPNKAFPRSKLCYL